MVEVKSVVKKFGGTVVLDNLTCTVKKGTIYGLVGANGAGKSTLMRLISGVYQPEGGEVLVDGQTVYENYAVKERIAFVPDELYFLPGANIKRMAQIQSAAHENYDTDLLFDLAGKLELDIKKPIGQFSKGMKRQAATILALSARPNLILFDETFDGLDPIVRSAVKRLVATFILECGATAVITSHSLRELEDTCDQLALLHKGGLVLESDVYSLKTSLFKIQISLAKKFDRADIEAAGGMEILAYSQKGSVANIIAGGDREQAVKCLHAISPILLDVLPLSLEEVFTYEMKTRGYDFNKIFGGGENE